MRAGASIADSAPARPEPGVLAEVARAATGRPTAVVSRWWREPMDHVIGSWGTAGLSRVRYPRSTPLRAFSPSTQIIK